MEMPKEITEVIKIKMNRKTRRGLLAMQREVNRQRELERDQVMRYTNQGEYASR